jgi:hypothetical protein
MMREQRLVFREGRGAMQGSYVESNLFHPLTFGMSMRMEMIGNNAHQLKAIIAPRGQQLSLWLRAAENQGCILKSEPSRGRENRVSFEVSHGQGSRRLPTRLWQQRSSDNMYTRSEARFNCVLTTTRIHDPSHGPYSGTRCV